PCWSSFPRFADSPGATLCRPLRGLVSLLVIFPPVRGLTGGYTLSPAARARVFPPVRGLTGGYTLSPAGRARVFVGHLSPGSRPHRELHSVARCAGSCLCWSSFPRFADSPGDSVLSPAARARVFVGHLSPGSRTHRGLHSVARCAGSCLSPGSRTHRGLHSVARCAGSCLSPGSRTHRGLHSVARCAGSCLC